MPSKCFGKLCSEAAENGKLRSQARKTYSNLCPACFHHQAGSQKQTHRSGGASNYCRNWPACQHWYVNGCSRYCVECFRACGGMPPCRKKPASQISRRPPTQGCHLKAPTKRRISSALASPVAAPGPLQRKRLRAKVSEPQPLVSSSVSTAAATTAAPCSSAYTVPVSYELANATPTAACSELDPDLHDHSHSPSELLSEFLHSDAVDAEKIRSLSAGTSRPTSVADRAKTLPTAVPNSSQPLALLTMTHTAGDNGRRRCNSCDKRARIWITNFKVYCKSCAHTCDRCHTRATFKTRQGKLLCKACAKRSRNFAALSFETPARRLSSHALPCSMDSCSKNRKEFLSRWTPETGPPSAPGHLPSQANHCSGFVATRKVHMHMCGGVGEGPFKCPASSGKTSCSLVKPGLRFHSVFHRSDWKLLDSFLVESWGKGYCSKHAAWLLKFLQVLEHLCMNGSLPLSATGSGLPRWLRRQLCIVRRRRFRMSAKTKVGERSLLPPQMRLLRRLPHWTSFSPWQQPSQKMLDA